MNIIHYASIGHFGHLDVSKQTSMKMGHSGNARPDSFTKRVKCCHTANGHFGDHQAIHLSGYLTF